MRVATGFVANHVEAQNGLLYVAGGFPEWWTLNETPSDETLDLALVFELEATEQGHPFEVDVVLARSDCEQNLAHLRVIRPPSNNAVEGAPLYEPVIVRTRIRFENVGLHEFRVLLGDQVLSSIRLGIRLRSND